MSVLEGIKGRYWWADVRYICNMYMYMYNVCDVCVYIMSTWAGETASIQGTLLEKQPVQQFGKQIRGHHPEIVKAKYNNHSLSLIQL